VTLPGGPWQLRLDSSDATAAGRRVDAHGRVEAPASSLLVFGAAP
jgi:hypothetical protein